MIIRRRLEAQMLVALTSVRYLDWFRLFCKVGKEVGARLRGLEAVD